MNMPEWDHYRSFLAVVTTGSLSGAARLLGLTKLPKGLIKLTVKLLDVILWLLLAIAVLQLLGLSNFSYLTGNTVDGSSVPASVAGGQSTGSMISALWPLMGLAAANVGNTRGHRPDFWLMAPRRWFAIAGSLDQQYRPIMSPAAQAPGIMDRADDGPNPVSNIHGIPVYTEGAIQTTAVTAGATSGTIGAVADTIYCGRTGDLYLFESDPMIQTSVNATAGTLQVRILLHRYAAFVGNIYTSAFGRVKSIPQPTTPGNF